MRARPVTPGRFNAAMRTPSLAVLGLIGACLTCSPPADDAASARRAWLQTTLRDDARPYIDRDPSLAAARFQVMAGDFYAFFRGTLGQFLRDARDGTPAFPPSAFGHDAAAWVQLVGDPHLENLGTFRDAEDRMVIDFNDFDAAGFGPYPWDVRRLAVSVAVAARMVELEAPEGLVRSVALGYTAEIAALVAGEPAFIATTDAPGLGRIGTWLLEKAVEDGRGGEALSDYTEVVDGARRLRRGELAARDRGVVTRAQVAPTAGERAMLDAALRDFLPRMGLRGEAARPLDVARRLGAGVASHASLRYHVLLPGPTAGADDDVLLEFKEVPPGRNLAPAGVASARPHTSEAARVLAATRALQTTPDDDTWAGAVVVPPLGFRVRERTGYQKGFEVEKLGERLDAGKWTPADLGDFAFAAGRLLARGHARAPDLRGRPGLAALARDLAGRETGFVDETTGFAQAYAERVADDADTFAELLAEAGPLLGPIPAP